MSAKWSELERGQPASETKRKHMPVRLFKEAKALEKQFNQISGLIDNTSVLNLGKKKEELLSLLEKVLHFGEKFRKQLKDILQENKDLSGEIGSVKGELFRGTKEWAEVKAKALEQERILSRIPPEILKEARQRGKGQEYSR